MVRFGSAPFMVRFGAVVGTVRHRLWYGSAVATLGGMSFLKYPLETIQNPKINKIFKEQSIKIETLVIVVKISRNKTISKYHINLNLTNGILNHILSMLFEKNKVTC
ncbi:hypothetical protein BpHYR1_037974 [Brachionus plicatilis]|uniref:Uncharacterized protein n=1 Tax=Brachionus plicatilis TaxID=10195 RepID=A0A3M7QLX7_BRAPC|nr:hypothetical protein BpHYR1_037974 [Brachionus plicatilis]